MLSNHLIYTQYHRQLYQKQIMTMMIIILMIIIGNVDIMIKVGATKYLDTFATSPGPLENEMTVRWSGTNFSSVDNNEMNLTLYNISGAWKHQIVAYNNKTFTISGLTVNQEYWFQSKWTEKETITNYNS